LELEVATPEKLSKKKKKYQNKSDFFSSICYRSVHRKAQRSKDSQFSIVIKKKKKKKSKTKFNRKENPRCLLSFPITYLLS